MPFGACWVHPMHIRSNPSVRKYHVFPQENNVFSHNYSNIAQNSICFHKYTTICLIRMPFGAFRVHPVHFRCVTSVLKYHFSFAKQAISSQLNQYRVKCDLLIQLYNKLLNSHPMHFRSIPSARKYSDTKFRVSTDCWFAAAQNHCYTRV